MKLRVAALTSAGFAALISAFTTVAASRLLDAPEFGHLAGMQIFAFIGSAIYRAIFFERLLSDKVYLTSGRPQTLLCDAVALLALFIGIFTHVTGVAGATTVTLATLAMGMGISALDTAFSGLIAHGRAWLALMTTGTALLAVSLAVIALTPNSAVEFALITAIAVSGATLLGTLFTPVGLPGVAASPRYLADYALSTGLVNGGILLASILSSPTLAAEWRVLQTFFTPASLVSRALVAPTLAQLSRHPNTEDSKRELRTFRALSFLAVVFNALLIALLLRFLPVPVFTEGVDRAAFEQVPSMLLYLIALSFSMAAGLYWRSRDSIQRIVKARVLVVPIVTIGIVIASIQHTLAIALLFLAASEMSRAALLRTDRGQ